MITRTASIGLSLILSLGLLTGCGSQSANPSPTSEGEGTDQLDVVTSFFPLYDFAKTIGGARANVVNLIPAGVEPHDWAPKSRDMMNISKADVFIYQGSGFEGWTDTVLSGIDTEGITIVEASKGIELMKVSDSTETHEGEPHEGDSHDGDSHEGESHEDEAHTHTEAEEAHDHGEYDPHTWLSPRSALQMAENVLAGLKEADPGHASEYEANYELLLAQLQELDHAYEEQLSALSNKEMVVHHNAFGYLARDYGLIQMPIMGISAEAEPTAQDIKKISEFVKEHQVKYIFTEALISDALAKTLAKDLGIETLQLHPLEGLTPEELAANETYVTMMEKNLESLVTALE